MATYEQLMDAARKADAKGDKTAAKRFLEMATSQGDEAPQFGPPEAPQVPEGMVYNPNTDQYTNREMLANNFNPTRTDAVAAGGTQGMTFGFGDELAGVAAGVVGGPDARTFATEEARAFQEASREAHPKTYIGSEIGGAMLTPGGKAKTLPGIIAAGAMAGSAYAAGTSEGDAADRAPDAIKGAIWGGIAAGGTKVALNFGSKAFNKLFTKSTERPTVPMLKATKTQAYKDVDAAGEVFGADEIKGLLDRVKGALDDVDYVEGVDTQTDAALKLLERHSTRDMTIGRLDKLRQNLWKRFGKADNEVGLLDAIEAIDDLIASRADTSDLMKAARLANSRYKKSQMLEDAFDKAMRQTEAAGSGGNVFNKYKQAINAIIDNPARQNGLTPKNWRSLKTSFTVIWGRRSCAGLASYPRMEMA
jgi:hypothetical protein